ncbi:DUF1802 domain-containing protein [Chloropicon primus]|nr:DUF1802 domain-containing protein [Chloropicon primus]
MGKNVVALKEWHLAVSALEHGRQTVIFRKGGIREPVFKARSNELFLFPTSFHASLDLIKEEARPLSAKAVDWEPGPTLEMNSFALVTGSWATKEGPSALEALDDFHAYTEEFGAQRLTWNEKRVCTILELQTFNLEEPILFPSKEDYFGCFSFIDVAVDADLDGLMERATPAVPPSEFEEKRKALREALTRKVCPDLVTVQVPMRADRKQR